MKTLRQAATISSCRSLSFALFTSYTTTSLAYNYAQKMAKWNTKKIGNAYLGNNLRQVGSDAIARSLLSKGELAVIRQQLVCLSKRPLSSLVAERRQRILQDVGGVGGAHHGDGAQVAEFEVLGEELAAVEDDGALGEDVAHATTDFLLGTAVGDGVGGHVEEKEVTLLRP